MTRICLLPIHKMILAIGILLGLSASESVTLHGQTPKSLNNPEPNIQERLQLVAAKILQTTEGKPVQLGSFTPTNLQRVNFGPGLRGQLQAALLRQDSQAISANATFIVKGDYSFSKSRDQESQPRDIKITARVIDGEFDEELVQIPVRIDAPAAIAEVLGITGATEPERESLDIERLFRKPSSTVRGESRMAASNEGKVEIEVLRQKLTHAPTECPVTIDPSGNGRISLEPDDVYIIRIHNHHDHEIAAKISIDGLSTFHFCDASLRDDDHQPLHNHYIIAPNSSSDVMGWFIRVDGSGNTRQFQVSGYVDSAAGQLGIPESNDTGVIHVQISRTELSSAAVTERGKGLATAIGQSITVQQSAIERDILEPFEFLTLRYDRPSDFNHQ